ncbi:MAG: RNA polymerase sigma factor [Clostridia bacterium]|nr:RNA polymerase sigma factor [Clostridia bacterium]
MNDRDYMARVRAMEGRLYRIAQAMLWRDADCADAIQEAVFRGWMKKAQLNEPAYFETWLIRILINQCKDVLRRRKRDPLPLDIETGQEDRLCEDVHLRACLKRLPEEYRIPLLLHHLEGYSIRDVAKMLCLPEKRVTARLYRARKALRALLDGGDDL